MDKRFVAIVTLVLAALAVGYFLLKRREYTSTHVVKPVVKEVELKEQVTEKLDEDVEKATVEAQ